MLEYQLYWANFLKFIFNRRIIALQYCVGFCHIATWISHRYTYVPSLLNLLPTSHPILPFSEGYYFFICGSISFLLTVVWASLVELKNTLLLLVVSSLGPRDSESHHFSVASPPQMLTLIECMGSSGSAAALGYWCWLWINQWRKQQGTQCSETLRAAAMLNPCNHVRLYLSRFLPICLCDLAN